MATSAEKTPLLESPPVLSANAVRLIALFSAVAEGFDLGVYSGVIVRVEEAWALSAVEVGVLSGILPIGIFAGMLISGLLADACGRRPALSVSLAVLTIGSVAMAVAPQLGMLLLGRLAVGIGIGIGVHSVLLYVTETSPASSRGFWGGVFELFISIGIFIGYLANFYLVGIENDWRIMLGLGAVLPSILLLLVLSGFLPESPRYLFLGGRRDEARRTLVGFVGESEATATMERWGQPEPAVAVADLLSTPQRRRQALSTVGLASVVMMSGMPVILNFSSLMLARHLGDDKLAFKVALLMGLCKVLATVVVIFYVIDAYGRLPLLYISSAGVAAVSFALAYAFSHQGSALVMLLLFCAWACCFEVGLGPVPLVYVPEVWDTPLRSKGTTLALGPPRILAVLLVMFFPVAYAAYGVAPCFLAFGVFCALSIPFIFFYCPETKQQKLEDLKDIF